MRAPEGTTPELVFLGLEDPLRRAAELLIGAAPQHPEPGTPGSEIPTAPAPAAPLAEVDLSGRTLVVPGGRARRQLLRALADEAERRRLRLLPPLVLLPEEVEFGLREPEPGALPVADGSAELLAWAAALEAADEGERAPLAPAGFADLGRRLAGARRLREAFAEIEAAELGCEAVAAAADELGGDGTRYRALGRIAARARGLLAAVGLSDEAGARAAALRRPLRGDGPVVALGLVDPSPRLRRTLAELGGRLSVHVLAEPAEAERFDALGVVRPEVWSRRPPEVPRAAIRLADRGIDQALAAVDALSGFARGGSLDADRCALVLADASLAEVLRRELRGRGVAIHDARGASFAVQPVARLLRRVADHLRAPGTASLRSLCADPLLAELLAAGLGAEEPASLLAALDRWREEHHDRGLGAEDFGAVADPLLPRLVAAAAALLAGFGGPRPLGEFAAPILGLMRAARPDLERAEDRGLTAASLAAVRDQLAAWAGLPRPLQPTVGAAEALDALGTVLAGLRVREEPRADELELLGWLELPFDPARQIVVVGMNEGAVPSSAVDPLLPDALRRAVGLADSRQRAARDAFVLSTAVARRAAVFIVGRRSATGEPLAPSRLLLTGRGPELAERVRMLTRAPVAAGRARAEQRRFGPPSPPTGPLDDPRLRISVTAFRRFLESPYHFWLEQVLRLSSPEPAGDELDTLAFGSVVHATLERFGADPALAAATDADRIHRALVEALDLELAARAGAQLGAPLQIQRRILQERLRWFAEVQAEDRAEGWRIHCVERKLEHGFAAPGVAPVTLVGKVDRIDRHADGRRWRILDYKTGDDPSEPDRAHLARDGTWRDLQLPLYHHLLADELRAEGAEQVQLGYFLLGASPQAVHIACTKRVDEHLDEAIALAREVVARIRRGDFDAPARVLHEADGIAMLCRTPALAGGEDDDGGSTEGGA
jgi:ATP-dependent helicase/nuclease subunit B